MRKPKEGDVIVFTELVGFATDITAGKPYVLYDHNGTLCYDDDVSDRRKFYFPCSDEYGYTPDTHTWFYYEDYKQIKRTPKAGDWVQFEHNDEGYCDITPNKPYQLYLAENGRDLLFDDDEPYGRFFYNGKTNAYGWIPDNLPWEYCEPPVDETAVVENENVRVLLDAREMLATIERDAMAGDEVVAYLKGFIKGYEEEK